MNTMGSASFAVLLIGLTGSLGAPDLSAHPGGLNREGCHNDRKNGTYHCHRNPRASRPVREAQSINGNVYYPNCTAARESGRVNIRRGQPGYRPALDRDNDGVACEG